MPAPALLLACTDESARKKEVEALAAAPCCRSPRRGSNPAIGRCRMSIATCRREAIPGMTCDQRVRSGPTKCEAHDGPALLQRDQSPPRLAH